MASPHVAGVVALVLHAGIADGNGNGLLADDVKAHLCAHTSPAAGILTTDARYPKWYGCGIVDADKSIVDFPPPPPAPLLDAVDDTASVPEDGATAVAVLANDTDPSGGPIDRHGRDGPGAWLGRDQSRRHRRLRSRRELQRRRHVRLHDHERRRRHRDGERQRDRHPGQRSAAGRRRHARDVDWHVLAASTLAANDLDIDGDALTVTAVGAAAHGTAVIAIDGTIIYTPAGSYSGSDQFTYDLSDGAGGTATGTVSVSIISNNSPPTAVDDTLDATRTRPRRSTS